jgi:transposase InsO family protein
MPGPSWPDFVVAVTLRFRILYVFVVMEVRSRKLLHVNATPCPTSSWTLQQLREAIPSDHGYRGLIHDRSGVFSEDLDRSIEALGIEVLKTPVRAPKANAYCERLIGSLRRECLDWFIPLNERHLRMLAREWAGASFRVVRVVSSVQSQFRGSDRRVGSRLVKDIHRLTRLRDPEDQERCIGARLDSAVPVIDVDSRFAESRRRARQLPWTMDEFHLRDLSLGVVRALAIEDRFGQWRIVQHEVDSALALLDRDRLKRENLDVLIGESLAEFSKRSGPVF